MAELQVPNLTAIIGEFGSGKSLYSLELGLYLANKYHKRFATNMVLDYDALILYCRSQNLDWLVKARPFFFYGNLDPTSILDFKNSVVVCDEAGSLFHARFWKNITKDFLTKLSQLRKLNIHLLLTYQYVEQIDKTFREQTQHFVLCYADTKYDPKLGLPKLLLRARYHFNRRRFEQYEMDIAFRHHPLKPKLAALNYSLDCPPLAWFLAELRKTLLVFFAPSRGLSIRDIQRQLLLNSDRFTLLFKCFDSSVPIAVSDSDVTHLFQPLTRKRRFSAAPSSPKFISVRKIN
jgi:hypothetical protein